VAQALVEARKIGARKTYLTHLCHDLGHAETEAALPAGVRIAYDGLRLTC
jgi:phosphoribosyl 1,2-cyclic phosphate phosphodiesterase